MVTVEGMERGRDGRREEESTERQRSVFVCVCVCLCMFVFVCACVSFVCLYVAGRVATSVC